MVNKRLGNDFTQGNIIIQLFGFLTPFLLANILNSIYNTVDMIIIGKYVGSIGIVAVSQGGKLLTIFTHISMSLAGAGQIMIAQQLGARKNDQVKSTIGTLLSILFIIALMTTTVSLLLAPWILVWLKTPEASFDSALTYLRITSMGYILIYGYNAVSSILRGMGESRMPLLFIAIAAAMNLVLDILFIGYFHLGAMGTALATVIGQGVSLVFSIGYLYKRREFFGFDFKWRSFQIMPEKAMTLFQIGLPMAASAFCIQFTQLIVISFVNQFGLVQAAAYGIGDKVIQLTNVVSQSVRQAGGAMVAQNLGARKHMRVKQIVRSAVIITLSFSIPMAVLSVLFPEAIFSMFSNDPSVHFYSHGIMSISALTFILAALSSSFDTVTAGSGYAKLSFAAGFLDGVVLRISLGLIFGIYFKMEAVGFFLGHSLARLSPVTIHASYYLSGKWQFRKLLVQGHTDVGVSEELEDVI